MCCLVNAARQDSFLISLCKCSKNLLHQNVIQWQIQTLSEEGGGGQAGFVLLALLAFLPSVIFSFFTQNKGGGEGGGGDPLDPSPRSATVTSMCHNLGS